MLFEAFVEPWSLAALATYDIGSRTKPEIESWKDVLTTSILEASGRHYWWTIP